MYNKVAIVILNWNGRKFLEQFLPGVIQHSSDAAVIVADNASSDTSVEWVQQNYPGVRVILNPRNEGFSKGYNLALRQVKAEYFILLNSDVQVTAGWLDPLLDLMEKNPQVAACQPKIRSFTQPEYFEYAGGAGGYIDRFGYPFCRGRLFDHLEKDEGQYDDEKTVLWATGACLMIRSKLYHQAGGLDEDFFAHMEEIDLCWRLNLMGYQVKYCPDSIIYHVGGGTLNKTSPTKTYLNFRNNLALLVKNLPLSSLIFIFSIRLILDGVAGAKFIFTDSFAHTRAVIRAHFYIYFNLGKLFGKRKAVRFISKVQHPKYGMYKGLVVWDYFIKGKKTFRDLNF